MRAVVLCLLNLRIRQLQFDFDDIHTILLRQHLFAWLGWPVA